GISRLMGTWKVIGSTNRWPRVINLWEMDGWDHWAQALERQFLPEKQDEQLAPWWTKATEWRSGGFDRILVPEPWSPSRDQLRAEAQRAWVCTHTIVRLITGKQPNYLDIVASELRPLLERRGLWLFGAYSAPMRSDEAILIWAAPDFRALCDLYAAWESDSELQAYSKRVAALEQESETMWMVPSHDCFFHPSPPAAASKV
ncbi:MAG TPA: hypothetical protein VEB21_07250, partial [Terriglobales bacterium]|nr:hypothetical protein [Terriglobales bacterium]